MTNVGMDRRILVRGHGRSSLWHSVDYRMICAPRHGIPTHQCLKALHANEIEVENDSPDRVEFKPFIGISPARYRDIFQKKSRKGPDGRAKKWYHNEERPMIDVMYPTYLALERYALRPLLESPPA